MVNFIFGDLKTVASKAIDLAESKIEIFWLNFGQILVNRNLVKKWPGLWAGS